VVLVVADRFVTAGSVDWGNMTSSEYVTGDINSGAAQAGWLVNAYKDSNANSIFEWGTDTNLVGQTILVDIAGMLYGDQASITYGAGANQIAVGNELFTVFLNNSVELNADWYCVSSYGGWVVPVDTDPVQPIWDAQGDLGQTWLPIPEPGTLTLMGLGLAAVVLRRRNKK